MASMSVKSVDELRCDEERRSLYLDFFGTPFVMGGHVGALLTAVEESYLAKSPLVLGVLSEGSHSKLLFFRQHTHSDRESLFSVDITPLGQITSITIFENGCIDPLRTYNVSHFIPARGKSQALLSPSVSGVSLKLTTSVYENNIRTKTLEIVKAPKIVAERTGVSPYVSSMVLTRFSVQESNALLSTFLANLSKLYAMRRPKSNSEKYVILERRLSALKTSYDDVLAKLSEIRTELKRYRSLLSDEELVFNKYKADVLVEQRNGNITSDLKINSNIRHGRGYDYIDNTPSTFKVKEHSEVKQVISNYARSHMEEINSTSVYDPVSGMLVVTVPSSCREQGYERNPLHLRLSELLSSYCKTASRHKHFSKQVEELSSRLTSLESEEHRLKTPIASTESRLNTLKQNSVHSP